MFETRSLLLFGLLFFGVAITPTLGQSPPKDTVIATGGEIKDAPFFLGDKIASLRWGDTLRVIGDTTVEETGSEKKRYLRVLHNQQTGWLDAEKALGIQDFEREFHPSRNEAISRGGWTRIQPADEIGRPRDIPERGDTLKIIAETEDRFRVIYEGKEGWVKKEKVMSQEEEREYQRELKVRERRARQRKRYIQGLRQKGYSIVLIRQTFRKNSADGISVGLGLANISRSKTIKYLQITWKLFNPVGDPTPGKNGESATIQIRLVGPLEPEGSGYTEFENVWYSSVGTCAEIRKIEVEHIDGSSFTYINDLEDIARQAETVRLKGDCSYEAQQKRK